MEKQDEDARTSQSGRRKKRKGKPNSSKIIGKGMRRKSRKRKRRRTDRPFETQSFQRN
jgi:hypothetical protein